MNITALLTRCRHKKALITLESEPFNGMDVRPADLRHMAQQFMLIADAAESAPLDGKYWAQTRIEIED